MAQIIVRQLPDAVHAELRVRAKRQGMSAEALVREILAAELLPDARPGGRGGLGDRLANIWKGANLKGATFGGEQDEDEAASKHGHEPISFE